jgi:hypothetical protein
VTAAPAVRERQRAAEAVGELAAELELEALARRAAVAVEEAAESGAVLEESRRPALRLAPERGCGGHVRVIGGRARRDDPWRE